MQKQWLLAFLLLPGVNAIAQDDSPETDNVNSMTVEMLDRLISSTARNVARSPGIWTFDFQNVQLSCLVSEGHDRMRLVAPIALAGQITEEHMAEMLEANYHSALDARYSTNEGVVYATFIHPLSPLTEDQFLSAMNQVASLVLTFGSSYSSGTLRFGFPDDSEQDDGAEEDDEVST